MLRMERLEAAHACAHAVPAPWNLMDSFLSPQDKRVLRMEKLEAAAAKAYGLTEGGDWWAVQVRRLAFLARLLARSLAFTVWPPALSV